MKEIQLTQDRVITVKDIREDGKGVFKITTKNSVYLVKEIKYEN